MKSGTTLIDSCFDSNQLTQYQLHVEVFEYGITVCVSTVKKRMIVAVWGMPSRLPLIMEPVINDHLNELLSKCPINLKGDYKNKSTSISTRYYSFIPEALFEQAQLPNYLQNTGLNLRNPQDIADLNNHDNEQLKYDKIVEENVIIAYTVNQKVSNSLKAHLLNYTLIHHKKSFLSSIISDFKTANNEIYVHYQYKQMDLAYFKNSKFHHTSTHHIEAPTDFLFFLLNSCEQLELKPDELKLVLFGTIKTGDEIHQLAFSYFSKIQFSTLNNQLQTAPALHELPSHYFYTAYKLNLCE